MKLTTVFLLIGCLHLSAASYSQTITLEAKEYSLKDIFRAVQKQTDFNVIYNVRFLKNTKPINISAKQMPLEAFLTKALSNQYLTYDIWEKTILIGYAEPKSQSTLKPMIEETLQERVVIGSVTDEQGSPLDGVTVTVRGTNVATVTDAQGRYRLLLPDNANVLVFTMLGFDAVARAIEAQSEMNVTLPASQSDLDEVVVVGYGTQKKSDLTGSVTRVDAKASQNQSMTQLSEMLLGTVAGFNANQSTTADGGSSLEIRGKTSLSASTQPLVVLDGVIFNGGLAEINPKDIETVDILKDASSAAVFGSRAASGVVIITTKKGHKGSPFINFQSILGVAEVNNKNIRPLNAKEYTDFRRDLLTQTNPNATEFYFQNPNELPANISKEEWLTYNNNPNADITKEWLNRLLFYPAEVDNFIAGTGENWFDKVMEKGFRQNYDLSISGGTEKANYYWSLGYTDNEGIVLGDEFSVIRSRLNLDTEVANWLKVGVNAQFANQDESAVAASVDQMLVSSPFGSMYNGDGSIKWYPNDYQGAENPLINYFLQDKLKQITSLFTVIYSQVDLPFGLSYRLSYQPRFSFTKDHNFWNSETIVGGRSRVGGYGTREDSQNYEWMVDNLVKWNRKIGIHHFDLTLLYNVERLNSWSSFQSGEDFSPNQNLSFHGLQFASNDVLDNDDVQATGDALMARLNYSLLDKYLFTASVRRDGYSAFGQKNPRATFPALAFAWKIDEEKFFSSNVINNLKLRLSWGINGNREIGQYAALARLSQNLYSNGSQVLVGVYNNSLANPNLVWEKTKAYNIGLDFGLFSNRINASLDAYQMTTFDLLMQRNLPVITGFDYITTNLGELQNRGFEVAINTTNVTNKNFSWKSNLVFSLNRNKIKRLFGDFEDVEINGKMVSREISDISNQWFIGQAIDRVWDYDIVGVWQENEAEDAKVYGFSPGDYKAVDVNGDNVYSTLEDKQFLGWKQPRYRIGFRNDFTFLTNFTASIFIRADLGHVGEIGAFRHLASSVYDRRGMRAVPYWTVDNPSNKYGSITASSAPYSGGYNIYFPRSFMRIQDLTLSYTFPSAATLQKKINNMRFFASVRNLYSLDKWEDWDPESGASPMPRIYSVGLDLTF